MKKKLIVSVLMVTMLMSSLVGCGKTKQNDMSVTNTDEVTASVDVEPQSAVKLNTFEWVEEPATNNDMYEILEVTYLYSEPRTSSEAITSITKGTKFNVETYCYDKTGKDLEFIKVTTLGLEEGYVPLKYARFVAQDVQIDTSNESIVSSSNTESYTYAVVKTEHTDDTTSTYVVPTYKTIRTQEVIKDFGGNIDDVTDIVADLAVDVIKETGLNADLSEASVLDEDTDATYYEFDKDLFKTLLLGKCVLDWDYDDVHISCITLDDIINCASMATIYNFDEFEYIIVDDSSVHDLTDATLLYIVDGADKKVTIDEFKQKNMDIIDAYDSAISKYLDENAVTDDDSETEMD